MLPFPTPYFLPYQARWKNDTSPLRICQKGRQVGLSYVDQYDSVLKAAVKRGKDVWVVSRDEMQSKQYIAGCKRWARALGYAAREHGEQIFTLANGQPVKVQVLTFASRPASTHSPPIPTPSSEKPVTSNSTKSPFANTPPALAAPSVPASDKFSHISTYFHIFSPTPPTPHHEPPWPQPLNQSPIQNQKSKIWREHPSLPTLTRSPGLVARRKRRNPWPRTLQRLSTSRLGLSRHQRPGRASRQCPLPLFCRRPWTRKSDHHRSPGGFLSSSAPTDKPVPILGTAHHLAHAARRVFPRAYIRRRRHGSIQKSKIKKVLILDPSRFQHIIRDNQLEGWRYTGLGQNSPLDSQIFLPEEIWFEKLPNPFDFWRGMAPLPAFASFAPVA